MMDYQKSINKELNNTLKDKIVYHKKRFIELFKARYLELIPSLINYKNDQTVSIDFMKLEIALRAGYDVVIGETSNRNIQVIGYATSRNTKDNPADLFSTTKLRHGDINFVISKDLQLKYYKEISYDDECQSGNFVVLRNKTIQYISDYAILDHYVDELAEIVLSRYSLSMQVKITTLFLGEPNDESMNDLITDIYLGNPYIKATKLFDPKEQIFHMETSGIAQNFQELKREYQNKIAELNTMLGINSLAVEKASGVSDEEANSNRGYTTTNANIYLTARNEPLKRLNKRYGLELKARYNDEVTSEFSELYKEQDKQDNKSDGGNLTMTTTLFNILRSELQKKGLNEFVDPDGNLVLFDSEFQFMNKILNYDDDVSDIVDHLFNGLSLDNRENDLNFKKLFILRFINRKINQQTIDMFKTELSLNFMIKKNLINSVYNDLNKYINQMNETNSTNNQTNEQVNQSDNITDNRQAYAQLPQDNVNLDVNNTVMNSANDNTISRNKQSNNQTNSDHGSGESHTESKSYQLDQLLQGNDVMEVILNQFDVKCFGQFW